MTEQAQGEISLLTATDLAPLLRDFDHRAPVCPGCGKDLMSTGLNRIVYTHEPCDCGKAPYIHLIETMWHRNCFRRTHCDND